MVCVCVCERNTKKKKEKRKKHAQQATNNHFIIPWKCIQLFCHSSFQLAVIPFSSRRFCVKYRRRVNNNRTTKPNKLWGVKWTRTWNLSSAPIKSEEKRYLSNSRSKSAEWSRLNLGENSTGKHLARFSKTCVTQQFCRQHQAEDEWTELAAGQEWMSRGESVLSHPPLDHNRKMSKGWFILACGDPADSNKAPRKRWEMWFFSLFRQTQQPNRRGDRLWRTCCLHRFSWTKRLSSTIRTQKPF